MSARLLPRKFRLKKLLTRIFASLLLLCVTIAAWKYLGDLDISYDWHWNRVWRYFGHIGDAGFVPGPLLKGIGLTITITGAGLLISVFCGLMAAFLILSPCISGVFLAKTYIALWRTTPLLLQLFIAYFLVSPLLKLDPFWTAAIALGLFEGAYFAEIFRAGILSVNKTQWEAALSLGFNLRQCFFSVILPQAARNTLPSLTNQAISLLKDSSLVSAIAVADLTMQSQAIVAETFLAFEVWLLAGAIYLFFALFLAFPALWAERRNPLKRKDYL